MRTKPVIPWILLALSLSANAVFAIRSGGTGRRPGVGDGRHWQNRETVFSILTAGNAGPRPVVFLGDSLTELCEWRELLGKPEALNRGIGFDTTEGLLQRLDTVTALLPRAVFLMIGVNDPVVLGSTPRETAERYGRILDRLRVGSPEAAVYVQSILPVDERSSGRTNAWVRETNGLIRELAAARGMTYVDLSEEFLAGPGGALNPRLTTDGIHLNGEGYRIWGRKIAALL